MISGLILSTQPHFLHREMKTTLLENPPVDQKEWKFVVPPDRLRPRNPARAAERIYGKRITFTATAITLEIGELSNNRILQDDDPSKFIAVSFGGLRFPETFLRVTGEYIQRLMEAGLYLNGTQYRFYHHSNSQLVSPCTHVHRGGSSRHCNRGSGVVLCVPQILMQSWIDGFIGWGNLRRLTILQNVCWPNTDSMSLLTHPRPGAKRIGLLFSGASLDFTLDPQKTLDIPDMTVGEEVFSDGCGLMARDFAIQVAKRKGLKFRNKRYTPTVFQIRCSAPCCTAFTEC